MKHERRHTDLVVILCLAHCLANPSAAVATEPEAQTTRAADEKAVKLIKTTITYREVEGHKILADVHRSAGDEIKPVIVWFHGGALINGHREGISSQILNLAREKDYAVVSFDYRLAPETKLPDIISDLEAAFRWLAGDGAKQFHLDPNRMVVSGGSAGGYLTFVSGYRARPRPKALVPFWGYGNLTDDWLVKPSPHPRHNPRKMSAEDAMKQTDGTVISDSRRRKGQGGVIYQYYRQRGIWTKMVSGFDPETEAEKIAPFEPVRNVDEHYPPTLMIHGTADTDVPHDQSVQMVERFKQHNIPHQLISIANGEHGLGGGNRDEIAAAYRQAREFIIRALEDTP
jgi:acetyl esterase/lipase